MILSIGLTRFINAEIIRHDGVEGVFIPSDPNGDVVVSQRGERDVFVKIALDPHRGTRKFDYSGKLLTPLHYADMALNSPDFLGDKRVVAWGYANFGKGRNSIVSSSDFKSISGEE